VGYRCLARGLSDLAAMGAKPVAAFLSFAIPAELNGAWVQCFLDGLLKHAERAGVPLVGGDTAQAPGLASQALFSADITLIGSVPSGTALLRSRARPGDLLYVTGQLGGSAAELAAISTHPGHFHRFTPPDKLEKLAEHPHLFPALRLIQGARLRKLASAALDLSDGLSTDLGHLCEASRVRAILEAGAIPIHPLADGDLSLALHGGEDYELLFSARPGTAIPQSIGGVPVTRIGRLIARSDSQPVITLTRTQPNGTLTRESLAPSGWQHFETVSARSARPAARSKNIDKPKA
jgi:thiamine-monophosphate kinase